MLPTVAKMTHTLTGYKHDMTWQKSRKDSKKDTEMKKCERDKKQVHT